MCLGGIAGTAPAGAQEVNLLPATVGFGDVPVGRSSRALGVKVTNLGPGDITGFSGLGVFAPFGPVSQDCTSALPLAPGASCTLSYDFEPQAAEVSEQEVTLSYNGTESPGSFRIRLAGTGVQRSVMRPRTLLVDFGVVPVGQMVGPFEVDLLNTGFAVVDDFAGGSVEAPFGASQNGAGGVASFETCQFIFSFEPEEVGAFSDVSRGFAGGGGFQIELRGSGGIDPDLTVVPSGVDFGEVPIGSAVDVFALDITNRTEATISFAGGAAPAPFFASQSCASGLEPGATCQYFYGFAPEEADTWDIITGPGYQGGTASGGIDVNLRGTGVPEAGVALDYHVGDFGVVPTGVEAGPLEIEVTNVGPAPIESLAATLPSAEVFSIANDCSGLLPLAVGESCTSAVRATPPSQAFFSTTATVTTNEAATTSIPLQVPEPAAGAGGVAALAALLGLAGLLGRAGRAE